MTTFKLDTKLADHLEQEIYEKLTSAVELGAKEYNADWKAREARGEKFETYEVFRWGETKTKKRYYYNHPRLEFMNVTFAQTEPEYKGQQTHTDYYRPLSCTVNYEACKANAKAQRNHSVGLLESRINGHLAVTDVVYDTNLQLGKANLIVGNVTGHTKDNEDFQIHTQMMWNYRYGENSANGY